MRIMERRWLFILFGFVALGIAIPCGYGVFEVGRILVLMRNPAPVEPASGNTELFSDDSMAEWGEKNLQDKDPKIRQLAAFGVMGRKSGPRAEVADAAIPILIEALKEPDHQTRWIAAMSLAQAGPRAKTAVPALKECLKDEDEQVRSCAAFALLEIDPEIPDAEALFSVVEKSRKPEEGDFVQSLMELLKDKDPQGRRIAALLLGAAGRRAKAAVPGLLQALKDKDEAVREAAARALKKIGPEAAAPAGGP